MFVIKECTKPECDSDIPAMISSRTTVNTGLLSQNNPFSTAAAAQKHSRLESLNAAIFEVIKRPESPVTEMQLELREMEHPLPKFSGDPSKWYSFMTQFVESTVRCGYWGYENFCRLDEALVGRARESVGSFMKTGTNLEFVLKLLMGKFGSPSVICSYVRQLEEELEPLREQLGNIQEFNGRVCQIGQTLLLVDDKSDHSYDVYKMQSKLPLKYAMEWLGGLDSRSGTIQQFMDYVYQLFSVCIRMEPWDFKEDRDLHQRDTQEPTKTNETQSFAEQPRQKPRRKNRKYNGKATIPAAKQSSQPTTTATPKEEPLKSDPLSAESTGVIFPEANTVMYCSGFEGLSEIIQATYDTLKKRGGNEIPYCAYAYYCAVLAHAKLLQLKGNPGYKASPFLNDVKKSDPIALKPLATYLSSFGSFKSPSGQNVKIRVLPIEYSDNGYFGLVNAETMVHYRMYPCMAVFLQYISSCIQFTEKNPSIILSGYWDLPEAISPRGIGTYRPNRMMLGWLPAETLTGQQMQFLRGLDLKTGKNDIGFHSELYHKVRKGLSSCHLETTTVDLANTDGSVGQLLVTSPIPGKHLSCNSSISATFSNQLDSNVAYLSAGLRFRMKYEDGETTAFRGVPYAFKDNVVPKDWIAGINLPRFMEDQIQDGGDFRVHCLDTRKRITEWTDKIKARH